jgi:hypothetical protein
MFAQPETVQIRVDAHREFVHVMEEEVPPLLRNQDGFLEKRLLVAPDKREAFAITLKQHCEEYSSEVYPEVLKTLRKCVEGRSVVALFEAPYALFHECAAVATF